MIAPRRRLLGLVTLAMAMACGDVPTVLIERGPPSTDGCDGDVDCAGATPRCDVGERRCVECVAAEDCTTSERAICDADRGLCVGCVTDGHCADPTLRCNVTAGQCAIPCTEEDDCEESPQPLCDAATGFCVGCVDDDDCDEEGFCRGSRCFEPNEEDETETSEPEDRAAAQGAQRRR